jgi:hypothetical protein
MIATLSADVLQDDVAVLLARVLAVANKRARELGVDVSQSVISISLGAPDSDDWRVNYGPKDYVGRRGGDLIVDIDAASLGVKQVLRGQ